jgi:hypothetical protein
MIITASSACAGFSSQKILVDVAEHIATSQFASSDLFAFRLLGPAP